MQLWLCSWVLHPQDKPRFFFLFHYFGRLLTRGCLNLSDHLVVTPPAPPVYVSALWETLRLNAGWSLYLGGGRQRCLHGNPSICDTTGLLVASTIAIKTFPSMPHTNWALHACVYCLFDMHWTQLDLWLYIKPSGTLTSDRFQQFPPSSLPVRCGPVLFRAMSSNNVTILFQCVCRKMELLFSKKFCQCKICITASHWTHNKFRL